MLGKSTATTLASQATPVPIAINVNMLRLRVTSECQPRTKNGQPAQSTTGVANSSWTQLEAAGDSACRFSMCPPISSPNTGTVRTSAIQKRRVMSASSGSGPASVDAISGSSAMPQIGQWPGPGWRICGCMGHV